MRVALVALGPSYIDYIRIAEGIGNRDHLFDEVWAVNGFGHVLQCDRTFHMDDVRIQEIRAEAGNKKIAAQLEWMKTHPGPIYTSRTHPDYPGLVAYPLEDVLNTIKRPYMNSTVAAAICFAIHMQVTELSLFGVDFSYPNMKAAEEGRACCEFWLGMAQQRGMKIAVPGSSTLLDSCKPAQLYGYDTVTMTVTKANGRIGIEFEEKDELPTAEQIEASYNHSLDDSGKRTVRKDVKANEGANGAGSEDQRPDRPGGRNGAGVGNNLSLAQESLETFLAQNRAEAR